MTGLRVVLAGDEAAGGRVLSMLDRSPHEVVAVAAKRNPGNVSKLWSRAEAAGISTIEARRLGSADVVSELELLEPAVLLNVHSLYKVHGDVLNAFSVGAWNLHPGPLPEAAGINVPSWAIANEHQTHGVTVHAMTESYDAGKIAYEDRFPVDPTATGLTLSAECGRRGLTLIGRLIDQLATDPSGVPRIPQDLSKRRLYPLGQPCDGVVTWSSPAATIAAHVRAADFRPFASPWSPPIAEIAGTRHRLNEVVVGEATDCSPGHVDRLCGEVRVAAADRWVRIIVSEVVT